MISLFSLSLGLWVSISLHLSLSFSRFSLTVCLSFSLLLQKTDNSPNNQKLKTFLFLSWPPKDKHSSIKTHSYQSFKQTQINCQSSTCQPLSISTHIQQLQIDAQANINLEMANLMRSTVVCRYTAVSANYSSIHITLFLPEAASDNEIIKVMFQVRFSFPNRRNETNTAMPDGYTH